MVVSLRVDLPLLCWDSLPTHLQLLTRRSRFKCRLDTWRVRWRLFLRCHGRRMFSCHYNSLLMFQSIATCEATSRIPTWCRDFRSRENSVWKTTPSTTTCSQMPRSQKRLRNICCRTTSTFSHWWRNLPSDTIHRTCNTGPALS